MKYLKTYNESFEVNGGDESTSDIVDIIKDRLIDLSDDGYNMNICVRNVIYSDKGRKIYSVHPTGKKEISVRIEKPPYGNTYFYIRDILDSIESLISNMNSNYNVSIDVCHSMRYIQIHKKFGESYIDAIRTKYDSYVNGVELTFHQRKNPKLEI